MKFHPPGTRLAQFVVVSYPLLNDISVDYICLDHDRARPVLLKTLGPELMQNQAAQNFFAQRGRSWVELGTHPHIVCCYDVLRAEESQQEYLVLQPVIPEKDRETASLLAWLAGGQPVPVIQALLFGLQIVAESIDLPQ